jgi:hypothetical protein
MVELVDTRDLKSLGQKWLCGFESRSRHNSLIHSYANKFLTFSIRFFYSYTCFLFEDGSSFR